MGLDWCVKSHDRDQGQEFTTVGQNGSRHLSIRGARGYTTIFRWARTTNFLPFVETPRRTNTTYTILHGARVFGSSATISSFTGEFRGRAAGWWWWFAEDHCRPRYALSPWLHKEVELIDREPLESLCLRRKFFFHCRAAAVSCDSTWYAPRKCGEFLRFRGIRRVRASAFVCKNSKHVRRRELSLTATSFHAVFPFDAMQFNRLSSINLALKHAYHWAFVIAYSWTRDIKCLDATLIFNPS